ncbi:MAG: hypothetical protein V1909_03220 [Candidatus Micrarchaeota archaeon]
MTRAKRKKEENFEWDEASGGFNFKTEETPGYDIPEDHVMPEQPSGYSSPTSEDNVLSRVRRADEQKLYQERPFYSGKSLKNLKSRSIFVESWSYNSLFPSMRSWSSIIALMLAPYAVFFFGVKVSGANAAAMGGMLPAAIALFFVTAVLASARMTVNHAVKDTLIHGLVLVVIALVYPWNAGPSGFINVAAIYTVSHIIAHGFDFHLERTSGRAWKLLFLVLFSTWILVAIGYGAFDLNNASVLS